MFQISSRVRSGNRDSLIREIAEGSAATVVRRLCTNTAPMSAAELRGYIRARATPAVDANARRLISRDTAQAADVDRLIAAALERTVDLVVRDRLVRPVIAIPAPHVRLRIAA